MRWRRDSVEVMAAPLAKTSAHVTMADGTEHDGVAVVIRTGSNEIRVTKGLKVIAAKGGVLTNTRDKVARKRRHVISFDDGTEWIVEDSKTGCKPCGR